MANPSTSTSIYPPPDPIPQLYIHPTVLAQAAYAVHTTLTEGNFRHLFFGGFELYILGFSERMTKDVDVEVEKPFIKGFEKIKDAFKADENYVVFDGTRTDGLRLIHMPTKVGIDVMMRGSGRLPKKGLLLPIPTTPTTSIPWYTPTSLFIEKVRSCGERRKEVDARDVVWLNDCLYASLDLGKIRKRLGRADVEAAVVNHPTLGELLGRLEIGG